LTAPQLLSFALIGGAVAVFAWGRFRYDVVALVALAIGLATGDVPMMQAFSGFTSDVVVIIACALVVSAAIARSGVIEWAVGGSMARLRGAALQVPVLAGTTALLSMMTKNVGALAIMMPIALRIGRNEGSSVSSLLMPMSFMSLLGGLVTLVGTSTNIIVSQVREETLGSPYQMFDFAPVGLILTALGFVFVSFGWRLLPRDRQARAGLDDAAEQAPYVTEARVPEDLPRTSPPSPISSWARRASLCGRLSRRMARRASLCLMPRCASAPAWCWRAATRRSIAFCTHTARTDARSPRAGKGRGQGGIAHHRGGDPARLAADRAQRRECAVAGYAWRATDGHRPQR
jgi:di/tricarboxylate transporter